MTASNGQRTEMSLEEHLAVPYVMSMESRQDADGNWIRHAAYPELPGVEAEGETPIEVIDRLRCRGSRCGGRPAAWTPRARAGGGRPRGPRGRGLR
jgi:hypothetical protein